MRKELSHHHRRQENDVIEYKVITEGDSRWGGAFDPEKLESMLNELAADGWRVVQSLLTTSVWKTARAEIFVILERNVAA
ncbi:MAG: DUF4177 domain-containing protein [Jatrophihabitantaceae bacterium]